MNKAWKAPAKRYRLRLGCCDLDASYSDAIINSLESRIERLEAQVHDRENLIRMENENYRRVNEELDQAKDEIKAFRVWNDNMSIEASRWEQRAGDLQMELDALQKHVRLCPECLGYGRKLVTTCSNCSGKGWIRCSTS